ncbi:MAG: hemolysin family protein [Armatimonadota bacterium]
MPEQIIIWEIVGVILSVVGLAVVSLMEVSLVSVNHIRIRQMAEEGHPTAPLVQRLASERQDLLTTFIILINVFVLLAANLTTAAARELWNETAVVWANLIVLAVLLVLGEITPKSISIYFAESIALRSARFIYVINLIMLPLAILFNAIGKGLLYLLVGLRILPGRVNAVPTAFSEEDIKDLITAGEQSGEVETTEREMIHGVIEFSDTTAREIMVPRTDLVALPVDATLEEAIEAFMQSGHSRIPVYDESVDDILGLLYVKDILLRLKAEAAGGKPPEIRELLREPFFVPESKKSDELLREMQRRRVHMAIVVDEYGGTAGVVTIEDLLEEIVGDIIDEYDTERLEVTPMPDGTMLVDGRASLDKIQETFDIEIDEETTEAETISGLVTDILGRIPEVDDEVIIEGIRFTVLEVSHNRAERLRAVALPPDEIPPEE